MIFTRQNYNTVQYVIAILALLFMFTITFLNGNPPIFDEVLFVRNMTLYKDYGLSVKFLTEMYDQAPGPLYQIVQSIFEPITGLKTPGIRLVNVLLFFLVIANTFFILKVLKTQGDSLLIAFNLVAIPVIWQVAGMALTEMPAMFLVSCSILILVILTRENSQVLSFKTLSLSLISGVCLGLAILGRTPFLMIVPASMLLVFNPISHPINRKTVPYTLILVFVVSSLAVCFPVFFIWKGLVPPFQAMISQGGLKLWHGILAFAYTGIIMLLVAPRWYSFSKRWAIFLIILTIIFFLGNTFWWHVKYYPLYDFLSRNLPPEIMKIYQNLISPLLMVIASFFVFNLGKYILDNRNNSFQLFIAFSVILVLLTCISIKHLFSTRYVAQAMPLLVLLIAEKDTYDKSKIARLLIGIAIGYISLQTYTNPT